MNQQTMTCADRPVAPWAWRLDASEAVTLRAEPAARWLRVECGSVWVTAAVAGPHGDDIWLGAGESLALPAGSSWVVQAWPQARLSLVQQPALSADGRRGRLRSAWRAWRSGTPSGWLRPVPA